ncbi:hypothetical protein PsorP6_014742 [Peronosclerospora sorghi]|uniref:Uncharacterized protein n=1 Tax=Peronosclerospora sorghi TaxID=230839 RepID=A0ACC0VSG6_9STRA|nr:hypothetical protein PsorP6_014742 [Peronosclerospora sorghi]
MFTCSSGWNRSTWLYTLPVNGVSCCKVSNRRFRSLARWDDSSPATAANAFNCNAEPLDGIPVDSDDATSDKMSSIDELRGNPDLKPLSELSLSYEALEERALRFEKDGKLLK